MSLKFVKKIIFFQFFVYFFSNYQAFANLDEVVQSPLRNAAAVVSDASCIPLNKADFDKLLAFLYVADNAVKEVSSYARFDSSEILSVYAGIKPILLTLNKGGLFHPTPESAASVARHIQNIAEYTPQQFKGQSYQHYLSAISAQGAAVFQSPDGNHAIVTPEWLSLSSVLHENNFEKAIDHSPTSPSGYGNWHHVFQTHDVIHLIPRAVHKQNHGALHPVTQGSEIDRQAFASERLRLNRSWALIAAIRSVSAILIKQNYSDDNVNTHEFLRNCVNFAKYTCEIPTESYGKTACSLSFIDGDEEDGDGTTLPPLRKRLREEIVVH